MIRRLSNPGAIEDVAVNDVDAVPEETKADEIDKALGLGPEKCTKCMSLLKK